MDKSSAESKEEEGPPLPAGGSPCGLGLGPLPSPGPEVTLGGRWKRRPRSTELVSGLRGSGCPWRFGSLRSPPLKAAPALAATRAAPPGVQARGLSLQKLPGKRQRVVASNNPRYSETRTEKRKMGCD